jgi:hypothetical protein
MGHVTRLSGTQNDELKEDEIGNACNTHGEKMDGCRVLVRFPER